MTRRLPSPFKSYTPQLLRAICLSIAVIGCTALWWGARSAAIRAQSGAGGTGPPVTHPCECGFLPETTAYETYDLKVHVSPKDGSGNEPLMWHYPANPAEGPYLAGDVYVTYAAGGENNTCLSSTDLITYHFHLTPGGAIVPASTSSNYSASDVFALWDAHNESRPDNGICGSGAGDTAGQPPDGASTPGCFSETVWSLRIKSRPPNAGAATMGYYFESLQFKAFNRWTIPIGAEYAAAQAFSPSECPNSASCTWVLDVERHTPRTYRYSDFHRTTNLSCQSSLEACYEMPFIEDPGDCPTPTPTPTDTTEPDPTDTPTPEPCEVLPVCELCDHTDDTYTLRALFTAVEATSLDRLKWIGSESLHVPAGYVGWYEPCCSAMTETVRAVRTTEMFEAQFPDSPPLVPVPDSYGPWEVIRIRTKLAVHPVSDSSDSGGCPLWDHPFVGGVDGCYFEDQHTVEFARRVTDGTQVYILKTVRAYPAVTIEGTGLAVGPADCRLNGPPNRVYEFVSFPMPSDPIDIDQHDCDGENLPMLCFKYRFNEYEERKLYIDPDVLCGESPTCGLNFMGQAPPESSSWQTHNSMYYRGHGGTAHGWDLTFKASYDDGQVARCGLLPNGEPVDPDSGAPCRTDGLVRIAQSGSAGEDQEVHIEGEAWPNLHGQKTCADCGTLHHFYYATTRVRTVVPSGGGFARLASNLFDIDVDSSVRNFDPAPPGELPPGAPYASYMFTPRTDGAGQPCGFDQEGDPYWGPGCFDQTPACDPAQRVWVEPCVPLDMTDLPYGSGNALFLQLWFHARTTAEEPPALPPVTACGGDVGGPYPQNCVIAFANTSGGWMREDFCLDNPGRWLGRVFGNGTSRDPVTAAVLWVNSMAGAGGGVVVLPRGGSPWEVDGPLTLMTGVQVWGSGPSGTVVRLKSATASTGSGSPAIVMAASNVSNAGVHNLTVDDQGVVAEGIDVVGDNNTIGCVNVVGVTHRGIFLRLEGLNSADHNLVAATNVDMAPGPPPAGSLDGKRALAVAGHGNRVEGGRLNVNFTSGPASGLPGAPVVYGHGAHIAYGDGNLIQGVNPIGPSAIGAAIMVNTGFLGTGNRIEGNTIACATLAEIGLANETGSVIAGNQVRTPGGRSYWQCFCGAGIGCAPGACTIPGPDALLPCGP